MLFYLFSLFSAPSSMKGSFTLYILLWIIFTLHLLIIRNSTWVLVPSNTLSSSLWVAVAKVTLFRGFLHINAAREVAVMHLMWWCHPSLRYFQVFFLLMCPRSTFTLLKLSGWSLWLLDYIFWTLSIKSEENVLLRSPFLYSVLMGLGSGISHNYLLLLKPICALR